MAITVKMLCKQFPGLKDEDIEILTGKSNFDDTTTISLFNIANYKGKFASPISIFTANIEGEKYTSLLSGDKLKEAVSNVSPDKIKNISNQFGVSNNDSKNKIPAGKSIFTLSGVKE